MEVKEYLQLHNKSLEELLIDNNAEFDSYLQKETQKNWLVPIENKLFLLNDKRIDKDEQKSIGRVINLLKSDEPFDENHISFLSTFTSKINSIVNVVDRINNFKEGVELINGSKLKLYDLFNIIKNADSVSDIKYILNRNLENFLPHLFSITKNCQDPIRYPIYYRFWRQICKEVLKLQDDYDSLCHFYRIFPEENRSLVFGSYFGVISKMLVDNIAGNNLIDKYKVAEYLDRRVINLKELKEDFGLTKYLNKSTRMKGDGEKLKKDCEDYISNNNLPFLLRKSDDDKSTGGYFIHLIDNNNILDYPDVHYEFLCNKNKQVGVYLHFEYTSKALNEEKFNIVKDILTKKDFQEEIWKKGKWCSIRSGELISMSDQNLIGSLFRHLELLHKAIAPYLMGHSKISQEMQNMKNLLIYKKQIILQGPPGTGKTRKAKEIAVQMLGVESEEGLEDHPQFKIVQFHPSYTYEDFVRGIAAKRNDEGSGVVYETENKPLGKFAEEALINWKKQDKLSEPQSKETWITEQYANFKETIEYKLLNKETVLLKENLSPVITSVEINAIRCNRYNNPNDSVLLKDSDIIKGYLGISNDPSVKIKENENLSASARSGMYYLYQNLIESFSEYLKSENKQYTAPSNSTTNKLKNYILIIDEINRANLSSVLGELIYALEYRGEEIDTMYAVGEYKEKMIIPPNLYIIGTMNTADRSVGNIDYAIRRRFAFVDVPPQKLEDNSEIYFNSEDFDKISKLFENNVSSEFETKDVKIGHSYFIAKVKDCVDGRKKEDIFKLKMKYEVLPILREYVGDGILIGKFEDKHILEFINSLSSNET